MARVHKDKAGTPQQSQARSLKTAWKKSGSKLPLKRWARDLQAKKDDEASLKADAWLSNKAASFRSPPQKVGRTRTRVKSGGGPKPQKNLSGK